MNVTRATLIGSALALALFGAQASAADDWGFRSGESAHGFGSARLPDGGVGLRLGQGLLPAGDERSLGERAAFDWRGRMTLGGSDTALAPIWRGGNWAITPHYNVDPSREADTNAGLLGASPSLGAGLRAEYVIGGLRLDGGLRQGVGGGASWADLGVAYMYGLTATTGLVIGGGVNWTSDDVFAAGEEAFLPGGVNRFGNAAGRNDIGGNLSLFYRPGSQWFGALNMEVDRSLNDPRAVGTTDAANQLFFGLIIGFSF